MAFFVAQRYSQIRDGETTINIKYAFLRGGIGGREEKSSKDAVFLWSNAMTIKI